MVEERKGSVKPLVGLPEIPEPEELWAVDGKTRALVVRRLKKLLRSRGTSSREVLGIARTLGMLTEINRRERADRARTKMVRDRNLTTVVEEALRSPEGRAALLAKAQAAYEILEHKSVEVKDGEKVSGVAVDAGNAHEGALKGQADAASVPS